MSFFCPQAGRRYRAEVGKAARWGRYDTHYTISSTHYATGQSLWNNRGAGK
ncbi:hypothetical protein Shyd_86020 [Streptomyces hydrogenans]|uniref:Uncharacterized protein n=1 Tax=Streptomyces hydrogenans TaxID=1873719 RepID=A0ABQ3PQC8_9ACTN|nr:hypothetical protein [Streptomyces hydrogenans]GHE25256.1 hypothetical protein GCM10018784_73740 [Streptomyces hydrogenans]GHI27231.1 hypothetical protein Shyd_86020 [Streptomyces hydrogenans]